MTKRMLVVYGSETGNSAELAELVVDRLRRARLEFRLATFGSTSITDLQGQTVVIICSTTGQGQLPQNAQPLWRLLLAKSLAKDVLATTKFAAFGLGDSSYPHFNHAIRKIHSRFLQLGATELLDRAEADDRASEPPEQLLDRWLALVVQSVVQAGDADGFIPVSELLPPRYELKVQKKLKHLITPSTALTRQTRRATVVQNTRITSPSHFSDVRHLQISIQSEYAPGDVAVLYPSNSQTNVDLVLNSQEWGSIADVPVAVDPEWASHVPGGLVRPLTLRSLLTFHLDLNGVPGRAFFAMASHFASGRQRERMAEFGALDGAQDRYDYANRPRRSLAEAIAEFDTLKIPLVYLLDLVPILRPRKFSIASPANQNPIDLCVAIVEYRTILRRIRRGVCTAYIASLAPGDELAVSVERNKNRLVELIGNGTAVLVATGTGIAPVRSLLHSYKGSGTIFLYYGCRYEAKDYLYSQEYEALKQRLDLHVYPAFSRDGKGYVQQAIQRTQDVLGPVLETATVFVCGSSGSMPKQVREALVEVLEGQGHTRQEAEGIMATKERRGRYVQETW